MPPQNDKKNDVPANQTMAELAQSAENELKKNITQQKNVTQTSPFEESHTRTYTPNPQLKTLRTFQGDMEGTIHKKNESIVSIAVAEQNVHKKEAPELLPHKEPSRIFLNYGILPLIGFILILTGVVTLGIIYYYQAVTHAPVPVVQQPVLISSTDKKDVIVSSLLRQDIMQNLVSNQKTFNKPSGGVLYVNFLSDKTTQLGASDFFQGIAPSAPATLTRSFTGQYMAGIYSSNPNKIFFILSTDDYGLTYSGMLKWESTMANDLSPFFQNIDIQSTSTPLFQDDSFNNHDVRVLRNSNGQIVLMYGFIDKNTLVIVPDETIFQSIANKYINSKLIH